MIYQPKNATPSNSVVDGQKDFYFEADIQTNTLVSGGTIYIREMQSRFANAPAELIVYNFDHISFTQTYPKLYNNTKMRIKNQTKLPNGYDWEWYAILHQDYKDIYYTNCYINKVSYSNGITTLFVSALFYEGSEVSVNNSRVCINDFFYDVDSYEIEYFASGNIECKLQEIHLKGDFSSVIEKGDLCNFYVNFLYTKPMNIFKTRTTPTVAISNVPTTALADKSFLFKGSYSQEQNTPIVYYQYYIYRENTDGSKTLIDKSGKIYSAKLSYRYSSFRTGVKYYVQMEVMNEDDFLTTTDLYSIDINYPTVTYSQKPIAKFNQKTNANEISWVAPVEHLAHLTSTIQKIGLSTANILTNIPYNGVNSLYTRDYIAKWLGIDGLCALPDDFNLTFQFSPDERFFINNEGNYVEEAIIFKANTDGENGDGAITVSINKNKLIFQQAPNLKIETPFYTNTTSTFVLSENNVAQINNDYVWDDNESWNDTYYWVEGGTSLERICNHWWKIQITKAGVKIEEIYP